MKLLRFITEEECQKVLDISKRPELITDSSKQYYHAEKMDTDEDILFMNTLLKEVIEGFVSFTCFTDANNNNIRLQYHWDERFVGVGWILITELRDGFKEELL